MPEVVIAFRRPPSMSVSEMRAWIIDREVAGPGTLALSGPDESSSDGLRLRVDIDDDERGMVEEELIDLMTDMRLLGLRPVVVPSGDPTLLSSNRRPRR